MTVTDVLARVEAALRGLELAMVSGQPDRVLAAEGPVADAAAGMTALMAATPTLSADDRRDVRLLADRVRGSMARLVVLGDTSASLLDAAWPGAGYGPRGGRVPAAFGTATRAIRS